MYLLLNVLSNRWFVLIISTSSVVFTAAAVIPELTVLMSSWRVGLL